MKTNYLKDSWSEITRDERTFCMYLFSAYRDNPDKLANFLKNAESPQIDFENKLQLKGKNWELGFEVCFYRDLLFKNGYGVQKHYELIKKKTGINPDKLMKRTFDLCLFSEKEIIIIEAKAHEPLIRHQLEDFVNDIDYIKKTLSFLGVTNLPNIYFVVLASSGYYNSRSFTLHNGVAREFLLEKKVANSLISWKQIAESKHFKKEVNKKEKDMILKADKIYMQKNTKSEQIELMRKKMQLG